MKRDIQIFDSRGGDRVIGIVCEDDVIVNIDFMQGDFDKDTLLSLTASLMDKKPNVHLLEIYKRITLQHTDLGMENSLKRACELYVIAFILQEIE